MPPETPPPASPELQIKAEMSRIREMYASDDSQESFNLLLCGEMGVGKTHIIHTARRPIHIDSFDPGGTKVGPVRQGIKEGWILVDSRFEKEDPMKPSVGKLWIEEMDKREKMGYFNNIGTYCIDSFSSWTNALMGKQLLGANIAGQAPRFTHDYQPVKVQQYNFIRRMMRFSCDFILTAHLKGEKDEASGKILMRMLAIGDASITLPTLFDEVWVAVTRESPTELNKTKYLVLTSPKGPYLARTRMGSLKFSQEEEPDIGKLLKKAGREIKHLPY